MEHPCSVDHLSTITIRRGFVLPIGLLGTSAGHCGEQDAGLGRLLVRTISLHDILKASALMLLLSFEMACSLKIPSLENTAALGHHLRFKLLVHMPGFTFIPIMRPVTEASMSHTLHLLVSIFVFVHIMSTIITI